MILLALVAIVFGPKPFFRLGAGASEFWRGLKRGMHGEHDIDVTESVRRLPPDEEDSKKG